MFNEVDRAGRSIDTIPNRTVWRASRIITGLRAGTIFEGGGFIINPDFDRFLYERGNIQDCIGLILKGKPFEVNWTANNFMNDHIGVTVGYRENRELFLIKEGTIV